MKTYEFRDRVQAVQITERTFTDPLPNPEHVKGIIYNPMTKTVRLPSSLPDEHDGHLGDWIVATDRGVGIIQGDLFAKYYHEKRVDNVDE